MVLPLLAHLLWYCVMDQPIWRAYGAEPCSVVAYSGLITSNAIGVAFVGLVDAGGVRIYSSLLA